MESNGDLLEAEFWPALRDAHDKEASEFLKYAMN
jgi:hypothetical protein